MISQKLQILNVIVRARKIRCVQGDLKHTTAIIETIHNVVLNEWLLADTVSISTEHPNRSLGDK